MPLGKLLVQTDGNLTLDVAVKMACQVEAAIGHVQTLTAEPQASVHFVKAKPRRQFKPKTRSYNPLRLQQHQNRTGAVFGVVHQLTWQTLQTVQHVK